MPLIDWYPRRKRQEERGAQPDVYQFDSLPGPFRVQVVHILREGIGSGGNDYYETSVPPRWRQFHNLVARELGLLELTKDRTYEAKCLNWFLGQASTDDALGMIELAFQWIDGVVRNWDDNKRRHESIRISAADAVEELNARFREHAEIR
jgi:hypothetical protein